MVKGGIVFAIYKHQKHAGPAIRAGGFMKLLGIDIRILKHSFKFEYRPWSKMPKDQPMELCFLDYGHIQIGNILIQLPYKH